MPDTPAILRPTRYLRMILDEFPTLAQDVDHIRRQRGTRIPIWPAWCWLPQSGASAIVTRGNRFTDLAQTTQATIVCALANWRMGQGVYAFDETLFTALWETPLTGGLPTELLYHLPEYCCYVPCTWARPFEDDMALQGFFVHLEWDFAREMAELCFLCDVDIPEDPGCCLLAFSLPLSGGTLEQTIAAGQQFALTQLDRASQFSSPEEVARLERVVRDPTLPTRHAALLTPLVSLTLYLCSTAAELRDTRGKAARPTRPVPTKTKRGLKTFPASQPTTWEVGWRIGAALRAAQLRADAANDEAIHGGVRAHLRRAHWHTYLTGKGRTTPRVRWLHPMLVGGEVEGLVATVRAVDGGAE
jgi:hypothetical protein